MLVDFKKLFDSFYKKNKVFTIAVVLIISTSFVEMVGVKFYKNSHDLEFVKHNTVINSAGISNIKKIMVAQDVLTRNIVNRESFNAYIKRKDEEYHRQMAINNLLSSKIGFLEGQIDIFSTMFDSFGFLGDPKAEVDCE